MISREKKRLHAHLKGREKIWNGHVHIIEYGKKPCTSTSERACVAQETNISQIKDFLGSFNSDKNK